MVKRLQKALHTQRKRKSKRPTSMCQHAEPLATKYIQLKTRYYYTPTRLEKFSDNIQQNIKY